MKVSAKMLLLWIGIATAIIGCYGNIAAAVVSAGAFIVFALIEMQEIKSEQGASMEEV